jgi:hypothetical protein
MMTFGARRAAAHSALSSCFSSRARMKFISSTLLDSLAISSSRSSNLQVVGGREGRGGEGGRGWEGWGGGGGKGGVLSFTTQGCSWPLELVPLLVVQLHA